LEKKTIGRFISVLRKAKGMTQKELGDMLFVSDKTVSRWECDESTPELSLIPAIAEIFGITADELLRGERNRNEEYNDNDSDIKRKAKSNKQFKLMLHERRKKFANLSLISVGLSFLGLISAVICDLVFSYGLLGFCLASAFFISAIICQISFTVSLRLLSDEDEAEYREMINETNTNMVKLTVKILFGILSAWAFCLPLAVITLLYFDAFYGLTVGSWLFYGSVSSILSFILILCIHRAFLLKLLINKEIVYVSDDRRDRIISDSRIIKKVSAFFLVSASALICVYIMFSSSFSITDLVKREKFDDPDTFISFMEREYDQWYEEGYSGLLQSEIPIDEPGKKWDTIDGKSYYYCGYLYESVIVVKESDEDWDIVVTTKEAFNKGKELYASIRTFLLSLHLLNFIVCLLWYLFAKRKY